MRSSIPWMCRRSGPALDGLRTRPGSATSETRNLQIQCLVFHLRLPMEYSELKLERERTENGDRGYLRQLMGTTMAFRSSMVILKCEQNCPPGQGCGQHSGWTALYREAQLTPASKSTY